MKVSVSAPKLSFGTAFYTRGGKQKYFMVVTWTILFLIYQSFEY
jgi:hypothetical protein